MHWFAIKKLAHSNQNVTPKISSWQILKSINYPHQTILSTRLDLLVMELEHLYQKHSLKLEFMYWETNIKLPKNSKKVKIHLMKLNMTWF